MTSAGNKRFLAIDSGFDTYFPGSDNFYTEQLLHFFPYMPGSTPYEWTPYQGHFHKMSLKMRSSPSTLEEACASGNLEYVVLHWVQGHDVKYYGADLGSGKGTLLMLAAYNGHLHIVRFLVDIGIAVNAAGSMGCTALHFAASGVHYHVVRFLLDNGGDPTQRDHQGYSVYFVAVQSCSLPLLLVLCEHHPVDVDERDEMGHTLLHWAAYQNSVAICQYLVENCRADVNAVDKEGRSPLLWAAREGFTDVIEYLLSVGAKLDTVDRDGSTALFYARSRNHPEAQYALECYFNPKKSVMEFATTDALLAGRQPLPQGYVPARTLRRRGTLSMLKHEPLFLVMAIYGILHVVAGYFFSMLLPPVLSYSVFGVFFFRNMFWMVVCGYPHQNSRQEMTYMQQAGIGRSFAETVQGIWRFRNRDAAPLFALIVFVLLQLYSWSKIGLVPLVPFFSVTNVALKPSKAVQVSVGSATVPIAFYLPHVMFFLCITLAASVVLCKLLSMCSVHERRSYSLAKSPVWKIVKQRAYNWLHPRIFFGEYHMVLPLRAFYCYERDVVMERYDGYSAALDCPIAASNHVCFFIALSSFAMLQWLIFICGWKQTSDILQCPDVKSYGGWLFRSAWNLLIHGLPCRDTTPTVVSTESVIWSFLLSYIFPSAANHLGVWLLHYSFVASIISSYCLFRQLTGIAIGATRMELANPTATSIDGGLVTIFPPEHSPFKSAAGASVPWFPPEGHTEGLLYIVDELPIENCRFRKYGKNCIYADSRFSLVNVLLFLFGLSGRRWRGAMAVSSCNAPIHAVALLQSHVA